MRDEVWRTVIDGDGPAPELPSDRTLLAAFEPLLCARRTGASFVIGQLGLSLDGRIATTTGDSKYINGQDALRHLHRIRALVDAVVIGAGTALDDDPRLDVRHCSGRSPARVIIDPNGRVLPDAKVWRDDGCRRVVFGGHPDLPDAVERISVPAGAIPVESITSALGDIGLHRLLIEGGADTLRRFMVARQIGYLHLLFGRVIIGSGKAGIDLPAISCLGDALRPESSAHVFADGDVLVACDLNESSGQAATGS